MSFASSPRRLRIYNTEIFNFHSFRSVLPQIEGVCFHRIFQRCFFGSLHNFEPDRFFMLQMVNNPAVCSLPWLSHFYVFTFQVSVFCQIKLQDMDLFLYLFDLKKFEETVIKSFKYACLRVVTSFTVFVLYLTYCLKWIEYVFNVCK